MNVLVCVLVVLVRHQHQLAQALQGEGRLVELLNALEDHVARFNVLVRRPAVLGFVVHLVDAVENLLTHHQRHVFPLETTKSVFSLVIPHTTMYLYGSWPLAATARRIASSDSLIMISFK